MGSEKHMLYGPTADYIQCPEGCSIYFFYNILHNIPEKRFFCAKCGSYYHSDQIESAAVTSIILEGRNV